MRKRLLSLALCFALALSLLPTGALAVEEDGTISYAVEGGNLYFDPSTGAITDCDTSVTSADIPSVINEVPVTSIGDGAFSDCSSLTSVRIPDGVTRIGWWAFSGCSSLSSVTIPYGVTRISNYAFEYCSCLSRVSIPSSVTSIGFYAFDSCTSLSSVIIPDGVTGIGQSAFGNCSSLTNVTFSDSVTSIGDWTFQNCSGLTSVRIPDSVTSIDSGVFMNCSSLSSVTIPNGVTSIGDLAFYNCSSLSNVYYAGTEEEWNEISMDSSNTALTNATIRFNSTGPLARLTFEAPVYSGTVGQTIYLWIDMNEVQGDASALASEIQWSVDRPEVASTLNMGKLIFDDGSAQLALSLRLHSVGTVVVTGSLSDGTQASCKVTVDSPAGGEAVSMPGDTLDFMEGQTSSVYAVFSADSSLQYTWTTSDPEVVAFSKDGQASVECVRPAGSVSECQMIYCGKAGTATITCQLSTGESAGRVVHVRTSAEAEETGYTTSNTYNRNIRRLPQNQQAVENLYTYKQEYRSAYNAYAKAIADVLGKKAEEEYDLSDTLARQAELMMTADVSNQYLNFLLGTPDDVKKAAYEGLCSMLYHEGVSEGVDFKDVVNSTNSFTISSNIVKKVANGIREYNYEYTDSTGKYVVSINCGGYFGTYLGTMTVKAKWGWKTYSNITICSSVSDSQKMCAAYLNSLRNLGESALKNVYSALAQDVFGTTLNNLASTKIQNQIKKLFASAQSKLDGTGLEKLGDTVARCVDYYQKCSALMELGKLGEGTSLADKESRLNALLNYSLDDAPTAVDSATKKAYSLLKKAQSNLTDALEEYYWHGTVTMQEPEQTWLDSVMSVFQCPVSVEVYNSAGEQIGYVGDDDIWYSDEILIEERGDTKIVYSSVNEPVSFSVSGTDNGMLSCTFEELENGEPLGRVNYYDLWLTEESAFSVSLPNGKISGEADAVLMDADDKMVTADEYLPASACARVCIETLVNDAEAGVAVGGQDYARGDPVKLYALENEGYVFMGWYDQEKNLIATTPYYEFTAREDAAFTAVFAEKPEEQGTEIQDLSMDGATICADVYNAEEVSVTALLAFYDEQGRLYGVQTQTVLTGEQTLSFDAANMVMAKLFLLDAEYAPLCPEKSIVLD